MQDVLILRGEYAVICTGPDGSIKWTDRFDNLVTTVGRTFALDAYLAGSGYVVVGPYMGLVTASGYTGINVADTMASHTGWTEATSYSGPRKTVLWSPASAASKSTSSPCFFNITGSDTIRGAFLVYGTGATNTVGGTAGVLYSVGTLSSDRTVVNGDALSINYVASL